MSSSKLWKIFHFFIIVTLTVNWCTIANLLLDIIAFQIWHDLSKKGNRLDTVGNGWGGPIISRARLVTGKVIDAYTNIVNERRSWRHPHPWCVYFKRSKQRSRNLLSPLRYEGPQRPDLYFPLQLPQSAFREQTLRGRKRTITPQVSLCWYQMITTCNLIKIGGVSFRPG